MPQLQNNTLVKIKNIHIQNFLSIHDLSLNFEDYTGINFIYGINADIKSDDDNEIRSNGAGKSAIFSALMYGLYGETIHKVRAASLSHHNYPDEPVIIEVELIGIDSNQYKIQTIIEKATYTKLKVLLKDTSNTYVEQPTTGIKDTRAFIEKQILGIPLEIFKRRVLLIDEDEQNFFTLRNDKKLQFIEKNFGLDVFGIMFKSIHADYLKIQRELTLNEQKVKQLETILADLKQSKNNFNADKMKKVKILCDKIKQTLHDISQTLKINIPNNEFSVVFSKVKELQDNRNKLENDKTKLKTKQDELSKLEYKLNLALVTYEKNKKKHEEIINRICEKCKSNIERFLGQESSNPESKTKLQKIKTFKDELTPKLKAIEQQILNLIVLEKNIERQINQITATKQQATDILKQQSPFDELIKKQLTAFNKEIINRKTNYERFNYLNYADYIMSENGVKQFIIKNIISEINRRIQHYLIKLGAEFSCQFDEKFNVEFENNGKIVEYGNFSSGEKVKLKLAVLFVFRDILFSQNLIQYNILVIDEFFDSSIDNFTIKRVIDILEDISIKQQCTIFIISHRDIIKNEISNRGGCVYVKKENSNTVLVK